MKSYHQSKCLDRKPQESIRGHDERHQSVPEMPRVVDARDVSPDILQAYVNDPSTVFLSSESKLGQYLLKKTGRFILTR